jgi:O-methyltransferase
MKPIHPVYSSAEVLEFTAEMTRLVIANKVEGCLIECGVAAGSQLAMMQKTQMELGEQRQVIGFDSFEGIPYATEHDATQPAIGEIDRTKLGLLQTTGVSAHSLESVIQNFESWGVSLNNVSLVRGWFEDTVKGRAKDIDNIALLRLDGDLYRSTLECMQHLFPKLSKGGVLIIDDYELSGCAKAIHKFINPKQIKRIHNIAFYIKP